MKNTNTMKASRINWSCIPNEARREELKKMAAKMKRKGYSRVQVNVYGAGKYAKYSIEGFNSTGGVWIA